MSRLWLFVTAISALLVVVPTAAADELDLPPEKIADSAPDKMMRRYLLRQANQAAERWKEDYEKRKTPAEIAAYQKRMREKCLEAIGGLPQRTPLNPQVTGTVSRPGYRVEKVLFQSRPKHFVTALHAAALEPQLFHSVRIKRSLRAWADIIHRRLSRDQMVNAVHGALAHYDLPDLAAALAEKITIERPADAMGTAVEDN